MAAPLLALSVPLFDTFSVIYIRWRNSDSIFLGDKRHFSHRLVALGMSKPLAVGFILLVGALVGMNGAAAQAGHVRHDDRASPRPEASSC